MEDPGRRGAIVGTCASGWGPRRRQLQARWKWQRWGLATLGGGIVDLVIRLGGGVHELLLGQVGLFTSHLRPGLSACGLLKRERRRVRREVLDGLPGRVLTAGRGVSAHGCCSLAQKRLLRVHTGESPAAGITWPNTSGGTAAGARLFLGSLHHVAYESGLGGRDRESRQGSRESPTKMEARTRPVVAAARAAADMPPEGAARDGGFWGRASSLPTSSRRRRRRWRWRRRWRRRRRRWRRRASPLRHWYHCVPRVPKPWRRRRRLSTSKSLGRRSAGVLPARRRRRSQFWHPQRSPTAHTLTQALQGTAPMSNTAT